MRKFSNNTALEFFVAGFNNASLWYEQDPEDLAEWLSHVGKDREVYFVDLGAWVWYMMNVEDN